MTTSPIPGQHPGHRLRHRAPRRIAAFAALTLAGSLAPAVASAAVPVDCASTPGGAVQVTADCVDQIYATPVIDSESDETAPVAHRRVRGHFEGTDIRFSIYLPPAVRWGGRFFQYTYPLTNEEADARAIGFALSSGGYAVQAGNATTSLGYRHAAASAKFAKTYAAQYYGSGDRRIYGYLYGASGGSFQTIGAAENTTGVWDGFAPLVIGTPMSTPYTFFIRAAADLVLAPVADKIKEAVSPGGSGDPYAGLDAAQRAMLKELTSFGVPLRGWENPGYVLGKQTDGGLLGFGGLVRLLDPGYVNAFWTAPGYLGTEQSPLGEAVRAALAAKGDTADNRWDIALPFYYRYQLPPANAGYYGFDQFRAADGTALYPQRPFVVGPLVTRSTSGNAAYSGGINAKVMLIDHLYDNDALPWHADWYANRVRASLGDTAFRQQFRIYYQDHSDHLEAPVSGVRATYLVDFFGGAEQALRDLAAWAENGTTPAPSTKYTVRGAQVTVPAEAARRGGVQPTVDLRARGRGSVTIKVGQSVSFNAKAEVPPGRGTVVTTAWDFEGDGTYDELPVSRPAPEVEVERKHRYTVPGIYYVAVKVTTSRTGVGSAFARVQNLDRVKITVL